MFVVETHNAVVSLL